MAKKCPLDGWEIHVGDAAYPKALLDLTKPPETIFGRGDPEALRPPCLSIIGARLATPYGTAIAKLAGRVAAECGVCVVSGGAMGCDCAAGEGALAAGGKTVVVAGCGADMVYPRTSAHVYQGALAGGGAVISLMPWGAPPTKWSFPRRNAIIAALSSVLVVTEAGIHSGTMSTADTAVELGRIIYAIPGSIFSPKSSGTNSLIVEGARPIPDERSLEMAISMDYGVLRFADDSPMVKLGPVMSALVASPSRPDDIAVSLNESVLTILKTLTEYEAKGFVKRLPDGRYAPSEDFFLNKPEVD